MLDTPNMSHVTCHVSRDTCHVSHVTCHMSQFFFYKVVKLIGWRVCYQQGLPGLFLQKTDRLGFVLLYMWIKYELIWIYSRAQKSLFGLGLYVSKSLLIVFDRNYLWALQNCLSKMVQFLKCCYDTSKAFFIVTPIVKIMIEVKCCPKFNFRSCVQYIYGLKYHILLLM